MSNGLPLLARCQPSILACKASRTASNSLFFGPSFWMIAESPAQNASAETPVLGVASLAMKSNRTGAIFNPWASTRFMMGFLKTKRRSGSCFQTKSSKKRAKRGRVHGPFSLKATVMRRPRGGPHSPRQTGQPAASDIGGEVHQFVEQYPGPRQHLLDLVRRIRDGPGRGVDRQLAFGRRLIIIADPGEPVQRAGARLGVMAFWVAVLADLSRSGDIDFAERSIGNAARRGAVFLRG